MTDAEKEGDDGSPLDSFVCFRVFAFERAGGPPPEDYRSHVDEAAMKRAQELLFELAKFAVRSNKGVKFTIEGNKVTGVHEKGPKLDISCYANDVFDIDRWPNGLNAEGRLVIDTAWGLDSDVTAMLAHRFVLQGDLEE